MTELEQLKADKAVLLHAVLQAYRKHHLNSDDIGWDELGDILHNAICNVMGDEGYQQWLRAQQP